MAEIFHATCEASSALAGARAKLDGLRERLHGALTADDCAALLSATLAPLTLHDRAMALVVIEHCMMAAALEGEHVAGDLLDRLESEVLVR